MQLAKALIRLRIRTGWSEPLLVIHFHIVGNLPDHMLVTYDISDPTQLNLTNNFFVICTNMNVYLYNYS